MNDNDLKREAAEAMYDALKGLIACVEQYGILCEPQLETARAAIDLADGHATIPGFEPESHD